MKGGREHQIRWLIKTLPSIPFYSFLVLSRLSTTTFCIALLSTLEAMVVDLGSSSVPIPIPFPNGRRFAPQRRQYHNHMPYFQSTSGANCMRNLLTNDSFLQPLFEGLFRWDLTIRCDGNAHQQQKSCPKAILVLKSSVIVTKSAHSFCGRGEQEQ